MKGIEVAAAMVFERGRLLVTQRPAGSHLEGLWEFPGGKREPGEGWEECLRRELREELEIEVEVGPLFEEVRFRYPEKEVLLRFYLARRTGGEPRAVGCAAWEWVDAQGLSGKEFPPADARLLERLASSRELWVDGGPC